MSTTATTAPAKAALPNEGRPGYKHTKLGWIPEEWGDIKLSRLLNRTAVGIVVKPAELYREAGEVICLRGKNVKAGYIDDSDLVRISAASSKANAKSVLHKNDIVLVRSGEAGTACVVPERYVGANCIDLVIVQPKEALLDAKYLEFYLNSEFGHRQIDFGSGGGGLRHFNVGALRQLDIPVPARHEQRGIAAVLGAWDRAIATAQQLLAAQQERKRGLMQELLTGKRRFPGFTRKWVDCELGELGLFRTSSVDKKLVDGQQRVQLVNYMDVYNNQRIHNGMSFMEVTAKDGQLTSSSLKRGDILFTPSSETPDDIGHSAVVIENLENTLFSYHVMRFRPHDDTLDIGFRAYVFNNADILKQFSAKATGTTRYTLSASGFGDTLVRFPTDHVEQRAITNALLAVDTELDSLIAYIAHLTTQKRGLMQQLLTGAVRVKV